MPLVIVNPTKKTQARRKRRTNPARKATKGEPMAKKRRSAAQKRAFHKMISRNPHRRRRRLTANPVRHVVRRHTIHRNPVYHHRRRRHRNPSSDGFLGSLFDKGGLMMLGAVMATPVVMSEAQSMVFPNATGYYQAGIQGAIGVAGGWLAYKFVDKQVGAMVAAIGIGTALAQLINGYNAGTLANSTMGSMGASLPSPSRRPMLPGRVIRPVTEAGARTLGAYTGAGIGGRAASGMSGYLSTPRVAEPGMRRI